MQKITLTIRCLHYQEKVMIHRLVIERRIRPDKTGRLIYREISIEITRNDKILYAAETSILIGGFYLKQKKIKLSFGKGEGWARRKMFQAKFNF